MAGPLPPLPSTGRKWSLRMLRISPMWKVPTAPFRFLRNSPICRFAISSSGPSATSTRGRDYVVAPAHNVPAVRGDLPTHTNNHTLLLINGRPVRESNSGGWNFPVYMAYPIDMIERIEFVRGPGSVLYGTNAYTGVINVITKEGRNEGCQMGILWPDRLTQLSTNQRHSDRNRRKN